MSVKDLFLLETDGHGLDQIKFIIYLACQVRGVVIKRNSLFTVRLTVGLDPPSYPLMVNFCDFFGCDNIMITCSERDFTRENFSCN